MAPRKKPSNTKAADKTAVAAKASSEDQPEADTVTQAGAGPEPVPAPDPAPEKDAVQDAGADSSAPSAPASDEDAAPQDMKVLDHVLQELAELKGRVSLLERTRAMSGQAVILEGLGETRDPMPDPLDEKGAADMIITVTGPEKGFYRAGHRFGLEPVTIPADTLSVRQIMALEDEPSLSVSVALK